MNLLVNAAQAIKGRESSKSPHAPSMRKWRSASAIPAAALRRSTSDRIFDPFFTTKEVGKGTGLGLHLAYNIIKKHNGSIEARSRIGQGTTFILRIPIEQTSESQEDGLAA